MYVVFLWVHAYIHVYRKIPVLDVFLNCFSAIAFETGPHTEAGAHAFDKAAGLVRSRDPIVSASAELGL